MPFDGMAWRETPWSNGGPSPGRPSHPGGDCLDCLMCRGRRRACGSLRVESNLPWERRAWPLTPSRPQSAPGGSRCRRSPMRAKASRRFLHLVVLPTWSQGKTWSPRSTGPSRNPPTGPLFTVFYSLLNTPVCRTPSNGRYIKVPIKTPNIHRFLIKS